MSTSGVAVDSRSSPQSYECVSVIGTGAYGTVYRAKNKAGACVAIKKIRIATSEDGMPMTMIREVSLLKQLENYDHPNIVKLKDVFTDMKSNNELRLMLVFEYIDQDLAEYLEKCPSLGLGPHTIKSLMTQMLNGIDFLHSHRIVHRDLKPQNILVNSRGQLKIADFGLARVYAFSMALTSVVVTLWYRAPEVLLQDAYCTAVDLWSCGCIFAELFSRKPLFQGQSELDQLFKIFEILGLPSEAQWPPNVALPRSSFRQFESVVKKAWSEVIPDIDSNASDLIEKLLAFDQHKRISACEALAHPYIQEEVYSSSPSSSSHSDGPYMTSPESIDHHDDGYAFSPSTSASTQDKDSSNLSDLVMSLSSQESSIELGDNE